MFQKMVEKLIENLPGPSTVEEEQQEPLKIDLVLEGGAFNGSYMLGILYFLKNHRLICLRQRRESGSELVE
jgi:hypothetical protein